jgi:acetyl esterase/lipase
LLLFVGVVAALLGMPIPAVGQSVKVQEGVQYGEADGAPLLLDAYLPAEGSSDTGVIVIHGGRWMDGDRRETPADMLAEAGFVAFSVDYRLAPEFPYPAALEDLQTAVRWVRMHAEEYGIDPAKIWAMGGSAGGHLAALLGTIGEGALDQDARVAAVVSWSGPMDLESLAHSRAGLAEVATQFVGCRDPDEPDCAARLREASPIAHLDPTDPPIFIANATSEPVPYSQAQAMADAASKVGVPHQLWTIQGSDHAFSYVREALEPTEAFVVKFVEGTGQTLTTPSTPPSPRATDRPPRERSEPVRTERSGGNRVAMLLGILAALGAAVVAAVVFMRASRGRSAW